MIKKSIITCMLALSALSYAGSKDMTMEKKKKVEEVAKDLAKPNTPYASLSLHYEQTRYSGDLENAESQKSHSLIFQPTVPFNLDNGDLLVFRPALPYIIDSPIPQGGGSYSDVSGFGDIAIDIMYANKMTSNKLTAFGLFAVLPTGSEDELSGDNFVLGPNLFFVRINPKDIVGFQLKQEWDVAGDGEEFNRSFIKPILTYLPGKGYNIGTGPEITYDHTEDQWEIPLNISAGKTSIINGRPWKFGVELNHYVEASDAFHKEWRVKFTVTPVVENVLDKWF